MKNKAKDLKASFFFLFILKKFIQPLEYVCAVSWAFFFYFRRYFFAPKFAPNGNLQNDKKSKLHNYTNAENKKHLFLIKVI